MVSRGEGRVLFTSSIASTMPGTYQAVYNASKSFVQSFALAIRRELKGTGVSVTALMPGPTDTDFFRRAHMEDTEVGASEQKDDPAEVARQGYEALMQGKERVVPGSLVNRLLAYGGRLVPDKAKAESSPTDGRTWLGGREARKRGGSLPMKALTFPRTTGRARRQRAGSHDRRTDGRDRPHHLDGDLRLRPAPLRGPRALHRRGRHPRPRADGHRRGGRFRGEAASRPATGW